MKLLCKGELQIETPVFGALAGQRCDVIELNWQDIRSLANAKPEQVHEFLELLQLKFAPPEKI